MNLSAIPLRPSIRVQRETLTGLMNALGFSFESRRVIGSRYLQEWAKVVTEHTDACRKLAKAVESFDSLFNPQ